MDAGDVDAEPPATRPSPEELVARAVAPVKSEFLRPPPVRSAPCDGALDAGNDSAVRGTKPLVKEKKSRRQLKRERKQEQKSALNICTEVAKTGKAESCSYGSTCRFSHDVEAYLALKAVDIDGTCPFVSTEKPCPYGLTCRFLGTHKSTFPVLKDDSVNREINFLRKDLQKLLWKNKVKFLKADAQLKLLGCKVGAYKTSPLGDSDDKLCNSIEVSEDICDHEDNRKSISSATESEVCDTTLHNGDGNIGDKADSSSSTICHDIRPLKKAKNDVGCSENGVDYGSAPLDVQTTDDVSNNVLEKSLLANSSSCKVDLSSNLHLREKKIIDFRGKLYLAPLTTVGNLPFRRTCKLLGADVTCGEMAMCTNLLQGQASEWALLRRHPSEDIFGVQICGSYPDTVARTVELIDRECTVDFIDINMGCPIDLVINKGAGSSLLTKPMRMKSIIQASSSISNKPLTVKVRTAFFEGRNRIDSLMSELYNWGAAAVTIHGRSRQQRYSKLADWDYINQCVQKSPSELHVIGNGDVFSFTDWNKHISDSPRLSTCMIARGALIKPWIFTEIKEQRHWDITSGERMDILKNFVKFCLEHWGSDSKGVETTRHFLLEWLSYTYRYIPVGLLDVVPQRLNWRPPSYYGRNDLETLMASDSAADWIRISEMLLGKVPEGFTFAPKHKSNAYDSAENG